MCLKLAKNKEFFKSSVLPNLLNLARDKVVNVRISVAFVIFKLYNQKSKSKKIIKDSTLLENEEFLKIAYLLKNDKNKNVNVIFENLNLNPFEITAEDKKISNHLFTNKMNFIQEEFDFIKNLPLDSKIKFVAVPNVNHEITIKPALEEKNKIEDIVENHIAQDNETAKLCENDKNDIII